MRLLDQFADEPICNEDRIGYVLFECWRVLGSATVLQMMDCVESIAIAGEIIFRAIFIERK